MIGQDDPTPLASLPGFPPGMLPNWTLGTLRDRAVMVGQFNIGRYTFEEALYEAFNPITVSQDIRDLWDDEMREYADECNRLAAAAWAAVMKHLRLSLAKKVRGKS